MGYLLDAPAQQEKESSCVPVNFNQEVNPLLADELPRAVRGQQHNRNSRRVSGADLQLLFACDPIFPVIGLLMRADIDVPYHCGGSQAPGREWQTSVYWACSLAWILRERNTYIIVVCTHACERCSTRCLPCSEREVVACLAAETPCATLCGLLPTEFFPRLF